tara:strand:+ start:421 stop:951 length:531 start_codon:yes stop_codon:yes gene_type:complete
MAKSDTFFIRASITPDDSATFTQTTIDLGAFVDALGKSVLRIINIEGEWAQASDGAIAHGAPYMDGDTAAFAAWQLTTQTQTGLVPLSDKATVGKGMLWARNADSVSGPPTQNYQDSHLPQHFSEGYLVAVEQLYLGAYGEANWAASSNLTFNMVLECRVESLTEKAAMALALSQQ